MQCVMNDVATVTATLPQVDDLKVASTVIYDWAGRVAPWRKLISEHVEVEGDAARLHVEYSVPTDKARDFANSMRDIGLVDIAIDGVAFVPTLLPHNRDEALATLVEYSKTGNPKKPRRQIVAVYAGSTELECGHRGKVPSGLFGRVPDEPRRLMCDMCLPRHDRDKILGLRQDSSWIEDEVFRFISR